VASNGFRNRTDAGRALARELERYDGRDDVVVLALPRGGVPVGYELAQALGAPLDIVVVRKLGVPGQRELAMGAIAGGGLSILDQDLVNALGIPEQRIKRAIADELRELERREAAYRGDREPPQLEGKTVILVDDGLATGATMRVAALAVRAQNPARVIVAVPVAPAATCETLRGDVDEVICALTPEPFYAVGIWYDDFSPTSDDEVRERLVHATRLT
jgi:putative phosphoribosyl transferase